MFFCKSLGESFVLFRGNSHKFFKFSGEETDALKPTGGCNFMNGQVFLSQKLGSMLHTNSVKVLKYSLTGVFFEQTAKIVGVDM